MERIKRCLCLFAGIFFLLSTLHSQQDIKTDYVWVFGTYDDHDTSTFNGSAFLDFSTTPPTTYERFQASGLDFDMYLSNSSFSNNEGELLMYTNGTHIYDPEGHIIPNGDSLSPSWWHWNSGFVGQSNAQGHFFLEQPNRTDTIWLFHQGKEYVEEYEDIPFIRSPLYYTKIVQETTDSVRVIQKNILLEYQTDWYAPMTAARHANGRDWWIIVSELDSRTKRFYLLTPDGITLKNEQVIGPGPNSPYNDSSGVRQNLFSPNGAYFMSYEFYTQDINLYSFDRCNGTLSNFRAIDFPSNEDFFNVQCSFSPNSRFIYANRGYKIVQLDLWANDLTASMDTIASINPDSFYKFEFHQLAPNGKIYINAQGHSPNLHVIHNPNEKGDACNFEAKGRVLPNWNFHSMPHFPYYRLGALPGSPCDTLTAVDDPPKSTGQLKVYPVPSDQTITIEGLERNEPVFIYNIQGQILDRLKATGNALQYRIGHLSPGMYWIRTSDQSAKFIRIR